MGFSHWRMLALRRDEERFPVLTGDPLRRHSAARPRLARFGIAVLGRDRLARCLSCGAR